MSIRKKIGIVLGTRPEIIKLAPVIAVLQKSEIFTPVVIASGQHKELAEQMFAVFNISPDVDLNLMQTNQSSNNLLALILQGLEDCFSNDKPDLVIVQGDTTTALGGALSAFHHRIPVAHVEAGLRTHNLTSPFPEEMNRSAISRIAQFHFCPTETNKENLLREGLTENIFVVGNTVVDALNWGLTELASGRLKVQAEIAQLGLENKKFILVTGHRRENFDQPIANLCTFIRQIVDEIDDLHVIYPVHPNPNIKGPVEKLLSGAERVKLISPVDYPTQIHLMKHARLIVSDSGGIQEEAPTLQTPVIVTRDTTERREAIESSCAELISLENIDQLFSASLRMLKSTEKSNYMKNPFGDGQSAGRIVSTLERISNESHA